MLCSYTHQILNFVEENLKNCMPISHFASASGCPQRPGPAPQHVNALHCKILGTPMHSTNRLTLTAAVGIADYRPLATSGYGIMSADHVITGDPVGPSRRQILDVRRTHITAQAEYEGNIEAYTPCLKNSASVIF